MADMYLGESAEPGIVPGPTVLGSIFNWTGALMSVALVGGLGMWGYQLAIRDVSGVPVVRALEGPMRVAPEDPGGAQADHQGFAVNSVAAEGVAAGPAPRLVLAPPPLDLASEDLPKPVLAAAPALAPDAEGEGDEEIDTAETEMLALAEQLSDGVTPLSAPIDAPEQISEAIPVSIPGVARSPLPTVRPEGDADPTAEAVANAVALSIAAPSVEVDADLIDPGTRLVQFGAFASPDEARAEWRRLDERFTDFFRDKKRVIEKAISGGKTFYRLRAMGFADIADARRFCSAFVAERQACIPVVAR